MAEVIKGAVLSVKDKTDKRGRPFTGVTFDGMDQQRYWFRISQEDAVTHFATLQRYHPITIVADLGQFTADGQMCFLENAVIVSNKATQEELDTVISAQESFAQVQGREREEAQTRREHQEQADDAAQYGTSAIPNGTYTVVFNDDPGDYETVRLKTQKESANFAPGKTIAQFLSGPENTYDYTGFGFVHGTEVQVWRRFQTGSAEMQRKIDAVKTILSGSKEDAMAAGKRYAMESGNCFVCGHELTVPESIAAGVGPVCAGGF